VNPDLQGRSYPPTAPYLVGREKVREFAKAVFATQADLVPPTFAIVIQQAALDQLLADPTTGIALERVVHGEQRFAFARPVVPGDELTGTMTVTSVRALGANAMVTAETAISDAAGERVATATSMLVVGGDE
jgi:acyl dehydratase